MKVGTDGVLVGAWARIAPSDRRMLDIGTGTGLIALMLAQRSADLLSADVPNGVRITGLDIGDVTQARENADASPWAERIEMLRIPVQEYRPAHGFDLIVSNPPFFVDSLTCPDAGRTVARHAVELTFAELRDAVVRLLAPEGRFAVILPAEEMRRFEIVCREALRVSRRTEVRTTPRRAPKRILAEFVPREPAFVENAQLTIGTGVHEEYTPEYRALTRDFYLKF